MHKEAVMEYLKACKKEKKLKSKGFGIVLVGCIVALVCQGEVVLYDGSLSSGAITDDIGATSFTYSPGSSYAFHAYNAANVTYTENKAAPFGGTDNQLQVVNNGGVDGVLRYKFSPKKLKEVAAGSPVPELLLADIAANPTLSFDVQYAGDSKFGKVFVDVLSDTAGAKSVTLLSQGLMPHTSATVKVDLGAGSAFQEWVSQMGNAAVLGKSAHLRIGVQSASGDEGTFYIDNVKLVSASGES
jgi:hypothetical protein